MRPSDARNAREKCCGIRLWGSAPKPGRREGKRVPCGHLGRRPKATRSAPEGSVSPVGCCAKRKATRRCEQIQGLRAASAQNADICEGSETMSAPEGSVSPVGCCAQRKATRRCEQIQGLRATSAQNADICERQGVRVIEQPGRPLHPALCRQTVPLQGAFFMPPSTPNFHKTVMR